MKDVHWSNLTLALQHGQCVLVLGPELPATGSDALTDADLRSHLSDMLAAEPGGLAVSGETLAGIAQQFEDWPPFGSNLLRSEAAQYFSGHPRPVPPLYELLAGLPFPLVLTTCQDDTFAQALRRPPQSKHPTSLNYHLRGDRSDNPELPPFGPDNPVLYHLFGHYSIPNSLVLSENDLLDFLIGIVAGRPPMPNSLISALQRRGQSFLFLGFGIRHWYLRVLLKVLVRALQLPQDGRAFALEPLGGYLAGDDLRRTVLFCQRGTRVEVLDDDAERFAGELLRRFSAAGGYKGRTLLSGRAARVFVSYASEDGALAARVHSALRSAQFDPWFDEVALQGGDDWERVIRDRLRDTDFVVVLHSRALAAKRDSFVNVEIKRAIDRAASVRGRFLIPLLLDDLPEVDWVDDLRTYQQLPLHEPSFDADIAKLISLITREHQLRQAR